MVLPGETENRNYWRIAVAVLVGAALLRLAVAATLPRFPDEAYYWMWSSRLAGGYFDHPPVIALLIRAGGWPTTPLGVRFMPVLAGFVATLATASIARRVGGDRAALRAAVLIACIPLAAAGLILATPDAPLIAATSLGLYAIVRALEHPPRSQGSLAWWIGAGLALGLALCSKYTSVVLAAAVCIALVTRADLRARLREPGPYVATVLAAVIFLPVLLWNFRHGWVSFYFQLRHGITGPKSSTVAAVLSREGDYLGALMGLASPVLFVFFAAASVRGLSRHATGAQRVFAVVALFTVAFFGYSALHRRAEANWPGPAYVPAIVLLATLPWSVRATRWIRGGTVLAGAISLVIYAQAVAPILPIRPDRDPVAQAEGWDVVAAAVGRARDSLAAETRVTTWAAADRYQDAALLAFHDAHHRETFSLNLAGRRNQYDLWPGFMNLATLGENLVLVVDNTTELHYTVAALTPYFRTVRQGELVTLRREGDAVGDRQLWLLEGWKGGWPPRPYRRSA